MSDQNDIDEIEQLEAQVVELTEENERLRVHHQEHHDVAGATSVDDAGQPESVLPEMGETET